VYLLKLKIQNRFTLAASTRPTRKILLRTFSSSSYFGYGSGKTFAARPVLSNDRATQLKTS
jgi:hypothetical protein